MELEAVRTLPNREERVHREERMCNICRACAMRSEVYRRRARSARLAAEKARPANEVLLDACSPVLAAEAELELSARRVKTQE